MSEFDTESSGPHEENVRAMWVAELISESYFCHKGRRFFLVLRGLTSQHFSIVYASLVAGTVFNLVFNLYDVFFNID